jgi:hypothetical protein
VSDTLRFVRSRGIPLEIISKVASRNGLLESMAEGGQVMDVRHLQLEEFIRVARSLGASWVQIGDSLGIGARAACKQFGEPLENCLEGSPGLDTAPQPFTPYSLSGSECDAQRARVDDAPILR